ncbi:MAG: transcription antitermination factor NusB [Phycisphaerales bacterium]|nr:MAG: transcription antitermination factor NusB [Phycisphaerales bacterium]
MTAIVKVDRHQARILAVQLLAQLDAQGESFLHEVDAFLAHSDLEPNRATRSRAASLVRRCWDRRAGLDERIAAAARHWSMDRMSPAERNVIRVALVELDDGDVPAKVAINEAIEISRQFGSAESARFVNGLLDAVWKQETRD